MISQVDAARLVYAHGRAVNKHVDWILYPAMGAEKDRLERTYHTAERAFAELVSKLMERD